MRISRVFVAIFVVAAAGCGGNHEFNFTSESGRYMQALPTANRLELIGEWDTDRSWESGRNHCSTMIMRERQTYLLVHNCMVNAGCCNGTHGFRLIKSPGASSYIDPVDKTTYSIGPDGALTILSNGAVVSHSLPTPQNQSLVPIDL